MFLDANSDEFGAIAAVLHDRGACRLSFSGFESISKAVIGRASAELTIRLAYRLSGSR